MTHNMKGSKSSREKRNFIAAGLKRCLRGPGHEHVIGKRREGGGFAVGKTTITMSWIEGEKEELQEEDCRSTDGNRKSERE